MNLCINTKPCNLVNKSYGVKYFLIVLFFSLAQICSASKNDNRLAILSEVSSSIKEYTNIPFAQNIRLKLDSIIKAGHYDEDGFVRVISAVGELYHKEGKLTKAIELYQKVVVYYEQKNNPTQEEIHSLIHFYIPLGASHEELGLWKDAMPYYLKALSLSEKYGIDEYKAMIYNNIGVVYYNQNKLEKSKDYMLKAIDMNMRNNNRKELFNNYNNLAGIYLQTKDENKALDYALQALQLLDKQKDADLYYCMQTNIANLYYIKKDYSLAISYSKNAMFYQEAFGFGSDLIQTYKLYSDICDKIGQKDSSFIYLQKALKASQALENKRMESDIRRNLADFYRKNNNFKKAYEALNLSLIQAHSIFKEDNDQKADNIERLYLAENKIRENELLVKDVSLQKLMANRLWIIMLTCILCLVVVALLLIYHFKNKERQRKIEAELVEHQKQLFEKEKKMQVQKEEDLKCILDQRNKELTSYTLSMMKTNEFISDVNEEFKQVLHELNPRDQEQKAHMQKIQVKLQRQSSTNDWDEFRCYFEQVHPSFYQKLEQNYPNLTIKDKRLCAFLRLGLSPKDIANITFKEVRSVETVRNRLRKKLGIDNDEKLIEFLSQI